MFVGRMLGQARLLGQYGLAYKISTCRPPISPDW